jgi:CHAT domain-containing protein
LTWAQLAQDASVIGGGTADLAECLTLRGILTQDLYEELAGDDDEHTARAGLLDEALQYMLEALALRGRLDDQESLALALGHVSSIYHKLGKEFLAFVYRLNSLVQTQPSEKGSTTLTRPIGNLIGLFWHLSERESREASELLRQHSKTLQHLARQTDPLIRGDLFDILGMAYREIGEQETALLSWQQAGTEYSASDEPSRAFYVWARAQDLAYLREKPEEIVEFGLQCIRTAPEDVSAKALASRHQLLAFGYNLMGRQVEAIAAYHNAACIVSASEDRTLPGTYLLDAAHIEAECGMLEEAREDFEKVLSGPAGAFTFWDAEYGLAEVFWRKGDLGAAIHWSDEAVALSIGNRMNFELRACSLLLSGQLHSLAGNDRTAIDRCDDLLKIFEEDSKIVPQSVFWYHTDLPLPHCVVTPTPAAAAFIGLIAAQRQGSRETIKRYLDLCLRFSLQEQAQTTETTSEAEMLTHDLSQLARADSLLLIDPKQAIDILLAALPLLEDEGPPLIVVHRTLGIAHFSLGDIAQARFSFSHVLELTKTYPMVEEEIVSRFYLGLIEMGSGALERAYDEFFAVIRAKESQRGSLADLDLRQGFPQGAYWALIEVCRRLGRTRELVETVEKLKSRVFLDLLGSTQHRPIDYTSLQEIKDLQQRRENHRRQFLLETNAESMRRLDNLFAEDPENASALWETGVNLGENLTKTTERLRHKGFLVELESHALALSFDEIRGLCASSTRPVVLIEYLVTATDVVVLGIRADLEHPLMAVIPLSGDRLSALANSGLGLRDRVVTETWVRDTAQLLAPAHSWSNEGDLLWLVPHGPLHGLPLHAAKLDGRYVIERNPVCYSTSASVLRHCRHNRTERTKVALVLGDPADNLPNARREAQLVAEMFGTTALVGGSATKSRLREFLEKTETPDILHFAGHSLFRSIQPLESAIELAPVGGAQLPDDDPRPDVLTAGEVFALSLRADLVTLSSCASGAQKVGPGDEPVGFARAFLYAGAASVLASLWPVDDLSTRILMEVFYSSLGQGLSKAEALQRAQLHLLHLTSREVSDFRRSQAEVRAAANPLRRTLTRDFRIGMDHESQTNPQPYSHPYFWAPFTLMGAWD